MTDEAAPSLAGRLALELRDARAEIARLQSRLEECLAEILAINTERRRLYRSLHRLRGHRPPRLAPEDLRGYAARFLIIAEELEKKTPPEPTPEPPL